jgi:hypothetical protein
MTAHDAIVETSDWMRAELTSTQTGAHLGTHLDLVVVTLS